MALIGQTGGGRKTTTTTTKKTTTPTTTKKTTTPSKPKTTTTVSKPTNTSSAYNAVTPTYTPPKTTTPVYKPQTSPIYTPTVTPPKTNTTTSSAPKVTTPVTTAPTKANTTTSTSKVPGVAGGGILTPIDTPPLPGKNSGSSALTYDEKIKLLDQMAANSASYTGIGNKIGVKNPGSFKGFTPITNFTTDENGNPNTPDQRVITNAVNNNLTTAKKGNSTIDDIYQAQKYYENVIKPTLPANNNDNGGTYEYGYGSGGSGSSDSEPVTYTYDYDASYLESIRQLLEQQKADQEKAANERYLALLGQYGDSYDSQRNAINLNNAYARRWLNQMYGGENSGAGLSNQAALMSNMNNNLYNAKKTYEQNKANALANKYDEMANASSNYASNYNNYVLQPYNDLTKQAIANDDQSFLKYLQNLGY